MTQYTRSDAYNDGGTFNNSDLFWYAKGVGELMARALDDPNSWWFFAAIHGEYVSKSYPSYPGWAYIPATPNVPTEPLPSPDTVSTYWNQCQHQSWYFPPWHRGYLIALEAQLREAITGLGGPDTWALPYWNYLGPDNQYEMPPAFLAQSMPDGSANPLFVTARYGPKDDGNIYIPVPPVSGACMGNSRYTGSDANTPYPGFGGPQTSFSHGGGTSGNLEQNPHNLVHVDVGGNAPDGNIWGLMADPGLAALDPIFYLHHCNIDRMWAAWNAKGNANPSSSDWLDGPAAAGQREFIMPMPGGSSWPFTPADVSRLSSLDYTYESLQITGTHARSFTRSASNRLTSLGVAAPASEIDTVNEKQQHASELMGSHDGALQLSSSGLRATVRLDRNVRNKVSNTLRSASVSSLPDRAYLQLENVRGTRDATKLNIHVNGETAGTVALFGLRRASLQDGEHGGSGLTLSVDITEIIDKLFLEDQLDVESLDVRVTPDSAIPKDADISVGRISVFREGGS